MDQNFITNVFVAKDIARTSNLQINDPSTTATYIQTGEIAVVQESTALVAASTPTKLLPIRFVQKCSDGRIISSQPIYGGDVKRIGLMAYAAPVEETGALMLTDDVIPGKTYVVRVVRLKTEEMHDKLPMFITGSYTATSTTTKATLMAGLATALNAQVANDPSWDTITFAAAGTNSDVLRAVATAPTYYKEGKFGNQQLRFELQLAGCTYTYNDNRGASLSLGGVTASACTYGTGSYRDVLDMEWFAANNQFGGMTGRMLERPYETTAIGLNAESTKTYDKVVIQIEPTGGDINTSIRLPNTVVLCLPISVVGSEQTADIITVLNKYFYTAWGLTQITGS